MATVRGSRATRRGRGCLLAAGLACVWWSRPTAPALVVQATVDDVAIPGMQESSTITKIIEGHTMKVAGLVLCACLAVAKLEPPAQKAPPAVPFEQRADASRVVGVSVFLSLVSGIVNAIAIIEMGGTVAHHTGNASHAGRLAGVDGARFAVLMLAYLVGAAVAGFFKSDGEALFCGKFSPGMLSGAVAVVGGAVIFSVTGNALVALPLLSFSQGLQNAITRKCSSLPVCTTHMTGYLTDLGSALGACARARGAVPLRSKFFLYSILAFVAGGFAAKKMLDAWGILVASFVPAALMAVSAFGLLGGAKKAK